MASLKDIQAALRAQADREIARVSQRFFKTGKGQYGEGDVFVGVRVPALRKLVKSYPGVTVRQAMQLLQSRIHEERLLALFFLVRLFQKGDEPTRGDIYRHYLGSTRYVNNWDLVDSSAPYIVGPWLADKDRAPLYRLAASENLWERRIAIMATFHYIKHGEFRETLDIAERLLADEHELIHKAAGWMLREIGKRDRAVAEGFLQRHAGTMPRVMLRYAIERFPQVLRRRYLAAQLDRRAGS